MARVLAVLLSVYLTIRFLDLSHRGALPTAAREPHRNLAVRPGDRADAAAHAAALPARTCGSSPGALYACAVMVVFGFIANRLNVAITGHGSRLRRALRSRSGRRLRSRWPSWPSGFAIFRVVAQYFPIFEAHEDGAGRRSRRDEPRAGGGGLAQFVMPPAPRIRRPRRIRGSHAPPDSCGPGRQARHLPGGEHGGLFRVVRLSQPARAAARTPRSLVLQAAERITDVILRSTHYEMLHNDREALYHIIQRASAASRASGASASSTKKGASASPPTPQEVEHGGGQARRGLLRLPRAGGAAGQAGRGRTARASSATPAGSGCWA